ncbi:MAG TPA: ATP-dependent Clp protease ATP-binding subunit ClpX, partial [candidate division Zixibacteria bacterium]|nr:ATP-dependent Clp protease ATP-binding subunit ClpX [candidate division Zixibacteria bacterium]
QYKALFAMDGVELVVEDDAIDAIVEEAEKKQTGARALKSIVERVFIPITYELPSKKDVRRVIITRDVVERGEMPIWVTGTDEEQYPKRA